MALNPSAPPQARGGLGWSQTAGLVSLATLLLGSLTGLASSVIPADRGAVVTVLSGKASSRSGAVLSPGASLRTEAGSVTVVRFPGGIVTRLDGGSELKILQLQPSVDTELRSGMSWTFVPGQTATVFTQRLASSASVTTHSGQLQATAGTAVSVTVWSGIARLDFNGKRRDLDAGSHATVKSDSVHVTQVAETDRSDSFTVLNRTLDAAQGTPVSFTAGTVAAQSDSAPQRVLLVDRTTELALTVGSTIPAVEVTLVDPGGNAYPPRSGIVAPLSLLVPASGSGLWSYRLHNPSSQPMSWWAVAQWRLPAPEPDHARAAVAAVGGSRATAIASRSPAALATVELGAPLLADQTETQLAIGSESFAVVLPFRRLPLQVGFPTADRPVKTTVYWPDPHTRRFLAISLMDSGRHELRWLTASSSAGPWMSDFAVSLDPDGPNPVFAADPNGSPRAFPVGLATDATALLKAALEAGARDQPASGVLQDSWGQNLLQARRASIEYLRAVFLQESASYAPEKAPADVVFLSDGRPLVFSVLRETSTVTSASQGCVDNPTVTDPKAPQSWEFFHGIPAGRYRAITRVKLIQVAAVLPTPAVPALQVLGFDSSTIAISATAC